MFFSIICDQKNHGVFLDCPKPESYSKLVKFQKSDKKPKRNKSCIIQDDSLDTAFNKPSCKKSFMKSPEIAILKSGSKDLGKWTINYT